MDGVSYTLIQRLLHWSIAVLVLGALIVGALLWFYGFSGLRETFGGAVTGMIYKYHKTAGVLILGLMVIRIAVRWTVGVPQPSTGLSSFERTLSGTVHAALYVAVTAMAAVGWLATDAGGFPVQFFDVTIPSMIAKDEAFSSFLFTVHGILGLVIAGLLFVHISAGLRHWLVKNDGVMQRMSLF